MVIQVIIDKIGWLIDVIDIDGFLIVYYIQLCMYFEKWLLLGKWCVDKYDVVVQFVGWSQCWIMLDYIVVIVL